MLKVDEAYLSRSQAFIFVLFSGLQGNGNVAVLLRAVDMCT